MAPKSTSFNSSIKNTNTKRKQKLQIEPPKKSHQPISHLKTKHQKKLAKFLEALAIFEDLGDSRSEARAMHLLAEARAVRRCWGSVMMSN